MTKTLADVCTITMGQAPTGDSYNVRGEGLPLIAGAGDFNGQTPAPTKFTTKPGKVSNAGDIVLSIRASIGAKVWSDGEYCLGRGVAGLRPGSQLDDKYLWHWLTRYERELASKGRGATFLQVNKTDIGEMPIQLPPLPEQRRIAAILDQADALRAKRRQALAHLDELSQSMFHHMFGDPTVAGAWPLRTVAEIAAEQKHAIVDGPFGSALKPSDYEEEGIPVIRIKNISRDGELVPEDLLYITPAKFATLTRSALQAGDVLVSRVGTLGNTCVFPSGFGDALLSTTGVCKITTNRDVMLPQFLHAAIRTTSFQRQIERSASTSVQKYFNLSALRAWRIITPPIDKQWSFVQRVNAIADNRDRFRHELVVTESLQRSLEHNAFSAGL